MGKTGVVAFAVAFILLVGALPSEVRAEYRIPLGAILGLICGVLLAVKTDSPSGHG